MSQSLSLDFATRHQVFVNRYAGGQVRENLEYILQMNRDVQRTLANATDLGAVTIAQAQLREMEGLIQNTLDNMGENLKKNATEFAENEAVFYAELIKKVSTVSEVRLPAAEVIAGVIQRPMSLLATRGDDVLTMNAAIAQFSASKARQITNIISAGVIEGQTTPEIARTVDRQVKRRTLREAESLVRTMVHHVAGEARTAVSEANSDIVSHELWDAVLDGRTTVTCASLDGKEFRINEGPTVPRHWNCRSARVPVVIPELRVMGTGTRASKDGPISANRTYGGWLRTQPASFQDEVLGPTRGKLFRSGGLAVDKFTDESGRVFNLAELRASNPLAFENAGIE